MNTISRRKILMISFAIAGLVAFYFLREVMLPFVIGLFMAYACNPIIEWMQRYLRTRALSIVAFFLLVLVAIGGISLTIYQVISSEVVRFRSAINNLMQANTERFDQLTAYLMDWVENVYSKEDMEAIANSETLKETLSSLAPYVESFFAGSSESSGISTTAMLIGGLGYFIYLIFDYRRLTDSWKPYLEGKNVSDFISVLSEAEADFMRYFRQRLKLVSILTVFYALVFWLIEIPGGILLGVIVGVLGFIPYLQYLGLIPLFLGCAVLSIETNNNMLIYLGIVIGTFVIASVIEELILVPILMKESTQMSASIIILSFTVWGYVFGLLGLLIALPLTTLLLAWVKRVYLDKAQESLLHETT